MTARMPLILLAAAAALPAAAAAETRGGFEAGLQVFAHRQSAAGAADELTRGRGTPVGLTLGYVETIGNGWFLRARFDSGIADLWFDAADGTRLDRVETQLSQLGLQVGRDIALSGGATLTPFTGIASRVADYKGRGRVASDGTPAYGREVSFAYVPVGAAVALPAGGGRVTLSAQHNFVLGNGRSRSWLRDVAPGLPTVTLDVPGGRGFEAAASLSIPRGRRAVNVGPFVRRWVTDATATRVVPILGVQVPLDEPRTRTTEWGLRLSLAF